MAVVPVELTWLFNRFRCIICASCIEACLTKCLAMDPRIPGVHDGPGRDREGDGGRAKEEGTGGFPIPLKAK